MRDGDMDVQNFVLNARGYSPLSPGVRDLPVRICMLAQGLSGNETPSAVLLVGENRQRYEVASEYGVWLTPADAASLQAWLMEFLTAAKARESST